MQNKIDYVESLQNYENHFIINYSYTVFTAFYKYKNTFITIVASNNELP